MDGTVLNANDNFLNALGYTLDEVKASTTACSWSRRTGRTREYREFWAAFNRGEYQAAEYSRIGKDGRDVWIQASYNPIIDLKGIPVKVVKFATDVTAQKLEEPDYVGQIAAIGKSQAVIEFKMDGTVLNANENFLRTLGYTLDEIKGRHHSMFVDEAYRQSYEYKEFWAGLEPWRVSGGRIQAHRQRRQRGLDSGFLQSDHGSQQQALQGGQVRHRYYAAETGSERDVGRRRSVVEGRCRRQAGHSRRRHQAPGRLPQSR